MTTSSFKVDKSLYLVRQEVVSKATVSIADVSVNTIAVIDCSGSMYGELPKIREQLKRRLPKILKAGDTFSLIWFSGRGQYGTLLEAEPVATLTDLKDVERAIDRWLQPQGMTGFKEPLEEVVKLSSKISSKNKNPMSLVFLSDGCDNQSNKADILKAVEKASGVVASSTFVEYGYYADRPLLTAMAEKAGGALIFAEDFDRYSPAFETILQKKVTGAPRVEVPISGDPVRGFVWAEDGSDLVTYSVEGAKARVSNSVNAVYYLSPKPIGTVTDSYEISASYAAMALFSARAASDVVLPFLKLTGDVSFIEKFGGLFGKQKYSEFMEEAKSAVFDEKKRLVKGYNPKLIPSEDAFTVLELLELLESDENNRLLLDHSSFRYNRIGRARVDAVTLLSKEEQEEVQKLTDELGKTKDVKKAKELNAKIASITNKPEPLKFEADPAPNGYSVSSLTYNEEKPNISFLVKKTGTVDISAVAPKEYNLPEKFPTFIYRNYTIIKDGLVNVEVLPVKLSEKTLETLFKAHKDGRIGDDVITSDDGVTFLNLKSLPIINRKMVRSVSADSLFKEEWELLKVQAKQKVLNSVLKENFGTKKSEGFIEKYGEAATWLKDQGFTEYSGFNPKSRQAESTDVYVAKELSVSIKGYSSIPSLAEFRKQVAKGKLTPSAAIMEPMVKDVEAFISDPTNSGKTEEEKQKALEIWVKDKQKSVDSERRKRLAVKAQQVFSIVVGQTWPFPSIDENKMDIELDGLKLAAELTARDVEVKILRLTKILGQSR